MMLPLGSFAQKPTFTLGSFQSNCPEHIMLLLSLTLHVCNYEYLCDSLYLYLCAHNHLFRHCECLRVYICNHSA